MIADIFHKLFSRQEEDEITNKNLDSIKKSHENELINENEQFLISQYHILSDRRISHNELFWEVPLMFFTAQAFLLMITLGSGVVWWSRAIAAFISFLFGLLSIQVFERDRIMENIDAEQLYDIENFFYLQGKKVSFIHHKPSKRTYLHNESILDRFEKQDKWKILNRVSSYELWKIGLQLSTTISVFLFVVIILSQIKALTGWYGKLTSNFDLDVILLFIFIIAYLILVYVYMFIEKEQSMKFKLRSTKITFICQIIANILFIMPIFVISDVNYRYLNSIVALFTLNGLYIFLIKKYRHIEKDQKTCDNYIKVINLILAGGKSYRLVDKNFLKEGDLKCVCIYANGRRLLDNTLKRNRGLSSESIVIKGTNNKNEYEELVDLISESYKAKLMKDDISRGTAYSIFYALLKDELTDANRNDIILITPSDHVIQDEDSYKYSISSLINLAYYYEKLFLIGIYPQYPAQFYGYLEIDDNNGCSSIGKVTSFFEKPSHELALKLLSNKKVMWNSGIFIAKRYILYELYEKYTDFFSCQDFSTNELCSFDELIVTKAINDGKAEAIKSYFDWADVGNPDVLKEQILKGICSVNCVVSGKQD